jgi:hypothetical protein
MKTGEIWGLHRKFAAYVPGSGYIDDGLQATCYAGSDGVIG